MEARASLEAQLVSAMFVTCSSVTSTNLLRVSPYCVYMGDRVRTCVCTVCMVRLERGFAHYVIGAVDGGWICG